MTLGTVAESANECRKEVKTWRGAIDFTGKVAVVTGAGAGLEHCHALELANAVPASHPTR